MQALMLKPETLTLLATAGILQVVEVRQLGAEDVDHLLESAGVRCIITHCFDDSVQWLAPAEQDRLWQEGIKPRLASPVIHSWDGWFNAWEWRTDQQEPIIVFIQCYLPI